MSETMDNLERGRSLAWMTLAPVFEHAMVLARESEYLAALGSDQAMTHIAPTYSPMVCLLAKAGQSASDHNIAELRDRLTRNFPPATTTRETNQEDHA